MKIIHVHSLAPPTFDDLLCLCSARTPSMSTFDSLELELARYSDDGKDADERVAGTKPYHTSIHYTYLHVVIVLLCCIMTIRKNLL